jgi:GTP-binding protein
MSIKVTVNSSPLAGTEGNKLTSTQIRERLINEAQNNVGIIFLKMKIKILLKLAEEVS